MEIKMKSMLIPLILLVLLASCGTDPAVETAATQTFDAALQTAVAATVQAEIIAAETNAFAPEATQQPTELPETTVAPVPTFT